MAEYTIDKIEYGDNVYNLSPNVVYATCPTAAATAAKVATITSGTLTSLNTGDQVIVKFTYANGKASPTLKVGSTDAKSIMRYGTTAPGTSAASSWNAGSCVLFVYDGTYWQQIGFLNSTYTVTDKKLEIGAVTSGTTYYPIVGNGTTAATRQYDSTGFEYGVFTGTTEAQGGAGIRLGNSTATGTDGNKKGFITIYGIGSNSSTLYGPSGGTGNYNVWLPNNGGILALTTDIPDVSGKIDTAGTGLSKSGTTLNHSNSVTAQTTQAVYPIKIDAQGHISAYGSAVTIPTVPANIVNTITTTAGTHTAITSQKGNVSFNVPTKTSHLTNDSGFITNAGVTSITTTAGAHTAITSATGAVSFKVPTTAAHVGAATSDHTHGNITNGGDITATAPTIANGDQIIINDNSASKITNGPTFDGSTTTTALTPKGTWETFSKFSGSYNDLTDKPTIPTLPSNIVNTITTTAGTHTAITNQTGSVSFNVPTKTSHLTNDSGFITSYTDEKLKWTASTSTNTYYPLVSTSTATTSTANTLNGINFYQYYNTAGGYRRLELGNTTANQSTGGAYGAIRLFGANATYYGDLVPGNPELGSSISGAGLSANRTWKLPDKSGTIALTSDLSSYLQKPTSNNNFGWILCSDGSATGTLWNPPETYTIGITEDDTTPGTYFLSCTPDEIRENFYSTYVLILNTYNQSTTTWSEHRLVNYYVEDVYENNDYMYQIIWFSGTKNYWDGTQIKTQRILCGIYLDSEEQYHTDGEVTVTINDNFAINDNVVIPNTKSYMAYNNTGDPRYLCGINASNQSIFGWGSFSAEEGASYFEGNEVYIQCKTGGVHINPNISGFYKITIVTKTLSSGISANSYVAAANISMTAQTGFNAVGIVGCSSSNFRVQPTTRYVVDNTHIFAGFANWTSSNVTSSVTVTFHVLWLKATSA